MLWAEQLISWADTIFYLLLIKSSMTCPTLGLILTSPDTEVAIPLKSFPFFLPRVCLQQRTWHYYYTVGCQFFTCFNCDSKRFKRDASRVGGRIGGGDQVIIMLAFWSVWFWIPLKWTVFQSNVVWKERKMSPALAHFLKRYDLRPWWWSSFQRARLLLW